MRVKNNKGSTDTWCGQELADAAEYDIGAIELSKWRASDKVITDLTTGDLSIGDGVTYKTTAAEAVAYLLGTNQSVNVSSSPAFADKKLIVNGVVKSLFKRVHGVSASIGAGATVNIDLAVSYPQCKFSGAEIFGTDQGDTLNYLILDTDTNTYSGLDVGTYGANFQLNQFGFDVQMPPVQYANTSNYDADLYQGMIVRCAYTNNTGSTKIIYSNLWLHEVK